MVLLFTGNAQAQDELSTRARQAVQQGDWAAYQEFVQKYVLAALANAPKFIPAQRYQTVISEEAATLALAQATFVRRVTPAVLKTFPSTPPKQEMLTWLLSQLPALEDFCSTIKPDEDAGEVLNLWAQLWQADPKGREKYYRLALACAVVFDKPVPVIAQLDYGNLDMQERYTYFRNSADTASLCAPIAELAPFELVWVVDAPVPTSELEWARRNAKFARAQWSAAYSSVAYRMDKAMRGVEPYKNYTLAEIKSKGGTCGDQAHFAAISAKANGIPAMAIFGTGQRGGHVWFGYKASAQQWNLTAGRYTDDNYATGYATDPQTGEKIKEQELLLLADPQRRQPVYSQATRLIWLAELLSASHQAPAAREALELAVNLSPRHLPAWTALFEQMRRGGAPQLIWDQRLATMRSSFRAYPDIVMLANRWEIEQFKTTGSTDQAAEALRVQQRRLKDQHKGRTDLLLDNIAERVALYETKGDLTNADKIYRTALRDDARDLAVWASLAERYYAFGERHNRRHEVVRRIHEEFRRHPQPEKDPFALRAYARLERQVADYLEKDGQKSPAKALRAQAEQRERRAATAN